MPQIHVLDQNTINQIAAGEVVDRPSSVVKELVENAIDAGATAITVEVKEGGISLVRVTDNGCGMTKDQIALAFQPHTTSKIRTADDLLTVSSLGFRGEALSSIASVAQVETITKTRDSLMGICYGIEGGKETSIEEIGAPDGTTFLVKNLFYNTPARLKFLKSPQTEGSYISDLMERMAMGNPSVSLRLIQNGQTRIHTTGNGKLKDVIYMIYGRDIASNLLAAEAEGRHIARLEGYLGKPVVSRGNRTFENYFINGRYMKNKIIAKAIETAYKPFMMQHRYPFTALHLTILSEYLDVNVHPAKMEVRFKEEELIFQELTGMISEVLRGKEFIPAVDFDEAQKRQEKYNSTENTEPFEINRREREMKKLQQLASYGEKTPPGQNRKQGSLPPRPSLPKRTVPEANGSKPFVSESYVSERSRPGAAMAAEERTAYGKTPTASVQTAEHPAPKDGQSAAQKDGEGVMQKDSQGAEPDEQPMQQMSLFDGKLLSKESQKKHRIIGQLFDTYWLLEFEDKLFLIDQHAAHEKVLYERMVRSLARREHTSQQISPPLLLSLSDGEILRLQRWNAYFCDIGFEIEHFGGKEYAVRAVPGNLFGLSDPKLFLDLLDSLEDDILTSGMEADVIREKVASMSCKAAIKGNRRMSFEEARALIEELMMLDNPYSCPHGRPVIVSMSRHELEKKFKRIV